MKVNLGHLSADAPAREVHASLDLSGLRHLGGHPIRRPVEVTAQLARKTGSFWMRYTADYTLQTFCSRCLEPVERTGQYTAEHILMEKVEDERGSEEIILVPGAELDLLELVQADLSLTLSDTPLCSEDCKGLCPVCGANRNLTDCKCRQKEPDSRFAVLRELLDKDVS